MGKVNILTGVGTMETVTTKVCPICEKKLTAQGWGGHMWGVHGMKTGEHAKLADVQKRMARLEETVPGSVAKLEEDARNRLATLEAEVSVLKSMHTPAKLEEGRHKTQLNI